MVRNILIVRKENLGLGQRTIKVRSKSLWPKWHFQDCVIASIDNADTLKEKKGKEMYWMHKLKTMRGKVSTNEIYINRYENIKQISCSPYIREERRSLIMNVLYMYYMFLYVWLFFIIFSSFYYLFTPSNYIITIIIITIMLINVNVTGIVEQQSEGEFLRRNSGGMVYPYPSSYVMTKRFQRRI